LNNITISLDDETFRQARIIAAQRETTVSALVTKFLSELTKENNIQRLKQLERESRMSITGFSASGNLSRDELYDRRK